METATIDPTKPKPPKPGEGWVSTADGQGWLPPDMAGSAAAAPVAAPARIAPAPGAPLTDQGGTASHQPAPIQAAPAAPAAAAAPSAPAAPTTVNDAFKTSLLNALNKPVGVDPNDPVMKGQMDAFSLAQTRAKQRDREAMASRAGASGQISDLATGGAFDEGLSNLEQRQGEAEAGFNANLAGDELNKQRDELYRYMALAGNQLNAEEARALQEKLFNIEAQIKREGMKQQGDQFGADLGLREELGKMGIDVSKMGINTQGSLGGRELDLKDKFGTGGLNLNLLQLLMGDDHFSKGEAGTNARFGAGLDADLWKSILGGIN
jgi:hypothetical protein